MDIIHRWFLNYLELGFSVLNLSLSRSFLAAFVRFSMKRLQINLPYTVVLFVCGAFVGLASHAYPEVFQLYTKPASIDPKILLHVFLPILIFESAFAMDAHVFIKCFSQCLIMAVPGLSKLEFDVPILYKCIRI